MNGLSSAEVNRLLGIADRTLDSEVKAAIQDCLSRLHTHFPNLDDFKMPEVKYDLQGTTAGQAMSNNVIRLNLDLLHNQREGMFDMTIPHEVAHIAEFQIWGRAGHKGNWRLLMALLGHPNPTRCHDYEVTKKRKHKRPHTYECEGCGHIYHITNLLHSRMQMGQVRTCSHCGGRIKYEGTGENSV